MITQDWSAGEDRIIKCTQGIPEGTKLIDFYWDQFQPWMLSLVLEHETFDPVEKNSIPEKWIVFQTIEKEVC
jgi:hypothetical protein